MIAERGRSRGICSDEVTKHLTTGATRDIHTTLSKVGCWATVWKQFGPFFVENIGCISRNHVSRARLCASNNCGASRDAHSGEVISGISVDVSGNEVAQYQGTAAASYGYARADIARYHIAGIGLGSSDDVVVSRIDGHAVATALVVKHGGSGAYEVTLQHVIA